MAQDLSQLTNMWMVDPYMFDPTQKSNQFSRFNDKALPFPPTYNGVPTDAMGRPIQSFVNWQQANPGGVSLNATPATPQPAPQPQQQPMVDSMRAYNAALSSGQGQNAADATRASNQPPYFGRMPQAAPNAINGVGNTGAAQQAGAPPNNWQAALGALSNPGNPQTMGASVPLQTGYQPSGGVNQAFLNQAGPGMNQNFLSALRAIQGR